MPEVQTVTGEQVREAVAAANITYVPHHECGGCGSMVSYQVYQGQLFFDPSCDCTRDGGPEPRTWDSAAGWINMQSNAEARASIMKRFGFTVEEETKPA